MKRLATFILSLLLLAGTASGQQRVVCDEACDIGSETQSAATRGDAGFAVVSPVGRGTVQPINQAPRLNTLSGKTIAVVGVSFMSRVTHPEIKRLIEKNYPDAHVLLLDEVGTAGPYPAPGITRRAKLEISTKKEGKDFEHIEWNEETIYERGLKMIHFMEDKIDGLTFDEHEINEILFDRDLFYPKSLQQSENDLTDNSIIL